VNSDQADLLRENRGKARAALRLVGASLEAYVPFDPAAELKRLQDRLTKLG
jgi:hypothetical protein